MYCRHVVSPKPSFNKRRNATCRSTAHAKRNPFLWQNIKKTVLPNRSYFFGAKFWRPTGSQFLILISYFGESCVVEDGDQIHIDGEQTGSDSTCPILRVSHYRRKTSPWRRNCSKMSRPQRATGLSPSMFISYACMCMDMNFTFFNRDLYEINISLSISV